MGARPPGRPPKPTDELSVEYRRRLEREERRAAELEQRPTVPLQVALLAALGPDPEEARRRGLGEAAIRELADAWRDWDRRHGLRWRLLHRCLRQSDYPPLLGLLTTLGFDVAVAGDVARQREAIRRHRETLVGFVVGRDPPPDPPGVELA